MVARGVDASVMRMIFNETIRAMEASGSEQTLKIYRRHGAPDPMFGISFSVLGQLRERYGVREAMNYALIAIGVRNPAEQKTTLAQIKRIGKVEVDHDTTNCETVGAACILKMVKHRAEKTKRGKAVR